MEGLPKKVNKIFIGGLPKKVNMIHGRSSHKKVNKIFMEGLPKKRSTTFKLFAKKGL